MIVHVGPSRLTLPARLGGAVERRMMELAEAQAKRGERVIVYSRGPETGWLDHGAVRIRYLGGSSSEFPLLFIRDLANQSPRVLHVHNRAELSWLARKAGFGPTVLSCDYHFEPWRRFRPVRRLSRILWRRCLTSCDRIAPVSDYCQEVYQRYWDLPIAKFARIPNGVDCSRFRPDAALRNEWRARLRIHERPLILYVGRLCEQKGARLLIEACRKLNGAAVVVAAGPCERFGAAGSNALAGQLQKAGGLYVPPLDDSDLPGIYNACDLFVMPTRELEMFGMAAVEAQACGKPVVASDHGGLTETVPEEAGMWFRNGDAADLTRCLKWLLDDPARCRELGAGARRNALQYDWSRIAARCQEVYAAL